MLLALLNQITSRRTPPFLEIMQETLTSLLRRSAHRAAVFSIPLIWEEIVQTVVKGLLWTVREMLTLQGLQCLLIFRLSLPSLRVMQEIQMPLLQSSTPRAAALSIPHISEEMVTIAAMGLLWILPEMLTLQGLLNQIIFRWPPPFLVVTQGMQMLLQQGSTLQAVISSTLHI